MPEVLKAPLVVEFPFTRSLGPVQSAFLTGLRERVVLGVRTTDGRTLVPPVEYDPVTAEEIHDLVRVAAHRHRHHLGLEPAPRRGPAPRHPLRLGPRPARRRRHRPAARPRRPRPRRRPHRACASGSAGPRNAPGPSPTSPVSNRTTRRQAHRRRRRSRRARGRPGHRHRRPRPPRLHLLARPRPVRLHRRALRPAHARRTLPLLPQGVRPAPRSLPHLRRRRPRNRSRWDRAGPSPPSASSTSRRRTSTSKCPTSTPTSPSTAPASPCTAGSAASPTTRCAWACASSPSGPEGARYPDHYRPTGEPDADYDVYKELL